MAVDAATAGLFAVAEPDPAPVPGPEATPAPAPAEGGSILGGAEPEAGAAGGDPGKKVDGTPAEAAKPAEGSKDGAPEGKIEIKLPEGYSANEDTLKEFTEAAKAAGLNSEQASALAKWDIERFQKFQEYMVQQDEARDQTWVKSLQSDPEFGGKSYDATVQQAVRAARHFGGAELGKEIRELGIGNAPALVRAFARIGRTMQEDNSGGAANQPKGGIDATREQRLAAFYDKSQPK